MIWKADPVVAIAAMVSPVPTLLIHHVKVLQTFPEKTFTVN